MQIGGMVNKVNLGTEVHTELKAHTPQKEGCLVCGKELEYAASSEEQTCYYCGKEQVSTIQCLEGHFVCDECHRADAITMIETIAGKSTATNPIQLAREIMATSEFSMHGPEHHVLVPIVLLATLKNLGVSMPPRYLKDAIIRAKQLPGGICGSWGACGAALGAGIGLSVMRSLTSMSREGWGETNRDTGEILLRVGAYDGPRCCKRSTYSALLGGMDILERDGVLRFPKEAHQIPVCKDFWRNKQCLKTECPYFPQ